MLTGFASMKGVKKTNAVIVCPTQQARLALCNSYAMNIDGRNKNYYSCGGLAT